jgi:hypothetical protein
MTKKSLLDSVREFLGLTPPKKSRGGNKPRASSATAPSHTTPDLGPSIPSLAPSNTSSDKTRTEQASKPKKVEWGVSTPASPPKSTSKPFIVEPRIDWGNATPGSVPNLETLIGVEDAYEHTPLVAGERVAYCKKDKIAFHLATWDFLKQQNQGRCCICGQSNVITIYTLPGTFIERPIAPKIVAPPAILRPGEKVIGLNQIYDHINFAVTVQDYVHEVYCTKSTGTYFVRFEPRGPRDAVYQGFKIVIFPKYERLWKDVGLSIRSYEGRTICVRGVIQVHPDWDIEILVNSPRVIEIVE